MKDIIRLSVIGLGLAGLMAVSMSMGKTAQADSRDEISWSAFCKVNGYDPNENSDSVINEYLDAWVGSAVEEEILLSHGIEP